MPITIFNLNYHANDNFDGFYIDFEWNSQLNTIPECTITNIIRIEDNFLSNNIVEYDGNKTQFIDTGPLDKLSNSLIWRKNPNLLIYSHCPRFIRRVYVTIGEEDKTNLIKEKPKNYLDIIYNTINKNHQLNLQENQTSLLTTNNQKRGMKFLQGLIKNFGQKEVYIMDPYLSYIELLNLFNPINLGNAKIKAITSKKVLSNFNSSHKISWDEFIEINRNNINLHNNDLKFNMEFIITDNNKKLHDRFLIFPKPRQSTSNIKVFSLGTSLNSIDKNINLIQEVINGNEILELFEEIWSEFQAPKYKIWSKNL